MHPGSALEFNSRAFFVALQLTISDWRYYTKLPIPYFGEGKIGKAFMASPMNLLSPSHLIIAPLLSLAFSSSVLAQAIPRLTQGMPYQKARQMLSKNGWQAVEVNPTEKEEI